MEKLEAIVVCGPTAAGKTDKAIELADKYNGEIVSIDSVQVYRGMDIGTAKPGKEILAKYPHHMIDIINPDEKLNAQDFAKQAMVAIQKISGKGRLPILAGGTGLYFKALLEGLFEGPGADAAIREKLQKLAEEKGPVALHEYLTKVDPESAKAIHYNNVHRVIRALEVFEVTGKKFSDMKRLPVTAEHINVREAVLLNPDRDSLYKKIAERTENMFANGLVEEVRSLMEKYPATAKGFEAIGYKETVDFLYSKLTFDETRELVRKNTCHYAKRQVTWFTNQKLSCSRMS